MLLFSRGNPEGNAAYGSAFGLSFDLFPSQHVSPMFLAGAFGVFNEGSFKKFAASDQTGGRAHRTNQHGPDWHRFSFPLSLLLSPDTIAGLFGCTTAALGQTEILVRCVFVSPPLSFSFPSSPSLCCLGTVLLTLGLAAYFRQGVFAVLSAFADNKLLAFLVFAEWMEIG